MATPRAVTICTLHRYYRPGHVARVIEKMHKLGPPILRGYLDPGTGIMLAEGTHRIRAAHALGVVPVIQLIPWWRSSKSLNRARYAIRESDRAFFFPRAAIIQPGWVANLGGA